MKIILKLLKIKQQWSIGVMRWDYAGYAVDPWTIQGGSSKGADPLAVEIHV